MESFATVGDYETRYGEVDDAERIGALLADASAVIVAMPGFALRDGDEVQAACLTLVTCAMVHRALAAEGFAGVSSYSETAGSYNASVNVYNPSGDLYLTTTERRMLGLGVGRVGQTDPY